MLNGDRLTGVDAYAYMDPDQESPSLWKKHGALILFLILGTSLMWNCAFCMWFVYLWGRGVL